MIDCRSCGEETNPNRAGVMRRVAGWELVRSGGGANQIVDRQETGEIMCPTCSSEHRYAANQPQKEKLL